MFLAYFDESGDAGVVNSPTQFFVLACILVPETDWLAYLDKLVALRTRLRQHHNVKTRPELKSTDIRRGRGPLLGRARIDPGAASGDGEARRQHLVRRADALGRH